MVAVSAARATQASPTEFVMRFELNGYPTTAPTGGVWDVDDRQLPARRPAPQGRAGGASSSAPTAGPAARPPCTPLGTASAFRPTPTGRSSTPIEAGTRRRDLTFILTNVHEVLNADDYLGI